MGQITTLTRRLYLSYLKRRDSVRYARALGVQVGDSCRLNNVSFSSEPYLVKLGDHVSASSTHFETHDGGVWVFRKEMPRADIIKPIVVGDNVYFGLGCLVLPGVTIGNNVVVGAGSVVTKDIPDNKVVAGVPAREIKTIDEYRAKVCLELEDTKHLTAGQKRTWYRKKYLECQLKSE